MEAPSNVPPDWRAMADALVVEHAWVLDRGDPRSLPDLYTVDGELLGLVEPLIGREALVDWAEQRAQLRRTSRHVHTNHRLWIDGDGRFRGCLVTLLYRHDADGTTGPTWPMLVLDYDDEYAIADDRCRFKRREVTRIFIDAERMPT